MSCYSFAPIKWCTITDPRKTRKFRLSRGPAVRWIWTSTPRLTLSVDRSTYNDRKTVHRRDLIVLETNNDTRLIAQNVHLNKTHASPPSRTCVLRPNAPTTTCCLLDFLNIDVTFSIRYPLPCIGFLRCIYTGAGPERPHYGPKCPGVASHYLKCSPNRASKCATVQTLHALVRPQYDLSVASVWPKYDLRLSVASISLKP